MEKFVVFTLSSLPATSTFNPSIKDFRFAGLPAVAKELFLSGTVFLTMANLVLIYVVHHVFNMYMGKGKPSFIRYIAVVMEMLLLGYERLAETALQLMNCVSIGSGKWLFIDANVPCLQ